MHLLSGDMAAVDAVVIDEILGPSQPHKDSAFSKIRKSKFLVNALEKYNNYLNQGKRKKELSL